MKRMRNITSLLMAIMMLVGFAGPITAEVLPGNTDAAVIILEEIPTELMDLTSVDETDEYEKELISLETEGALAAVSRLVAAGIVTGYEDGSLGLDDEVTRAQMATILTKSLGLEKEI